MYMSDEGSENDAKPEARYYQLFGGCVTNHGIFNLRESGRGAQMPSDHAGGDCCPVIAVP